MNIKMYIPVYYQTGEDENVRSIESSLKVSIFE